MKHILFSALMAAATLSSCAAIPMATDIAGGKTSQYTETFTLPQKGDVAASMAAFSEVMKKDGWKKSHQSSTEVGFEKSSSQLAGYGMSKHYTMNVQADFSGDTVKLYLIETGNYKTGTEENAQKIIAKIKTDYQAMQ